MLYFQYVPLALALIFGTPQVGAMLPDAAQQANAQEVVLKTEPTLRDRCKPLAELISKGEGTWDSVNRGYAGDTPGGIRSLIGKSFSDLTLREVMSLQRWRIYAVGRYQFIPSTLRSAVAKSGLSHNEKFTPETQTALFITLLKHKRPSIAAYLNGEGDLARALDDLAKEWASVAWRDGRSYYGYGGNRAHISRERAKQALQEGRAM